MPPLEITLRPPPDPNDLRLVVNAIDYGGWTSVRVTRSIERMPAEFEIALTERVPGSSTTIVAKHGDSCEVFLGADRVLVGYIDTVDMRLEASEHRIEIRGRSKSADLIDCSAEWPGGQVANCNAVTIAQRLAQPYGIEVKSTADPGPIIPQFNITIGETAFSVIERVCRYAGLLVYDQADGTVVLSGVGTRKAASGIAEAQNLLGANVRLSVAERFSKYESFVVAFDSLEDVSDRGNFIHSASDAGVTRHRIKRFVSEALDADFSVTRKRCEWEAARRAGRGTIVRARVDNWRDKAGKLWEPNTLVAVDIPTLRITSKELLIGEVTYRRDEQGTRAELVLMPPSSFVPQPVVLDPLPLQSINQTGGR